MEENLIYLVGFFIIVVIVLILIIIKLEKRVSSLLAGKNAKSLEDTILHVISEIKRIDTDWQSKEKVIKDINKRLKSNGRGVGLVRFNPFTNSGGNQSFAVAFLNEHGDGVIISTLYGRERTSIFAKPIKKYKSEFELTKEEAESLQKAS